MADNQLVWSSKPPADKETADGRRVVTPVMPFHTRKFADKVRQKAKKLNREKEAALARRKEERQIRHQQLLEEQRQRKEERIKRHMETNINRRFGEAVTNKREALGLSTAQLASVLGFEESFLLRVETGEQGLYFDNALKVATLLQIRLDLFVELQDIHQQRQKLTAAIAEKEKAVEDELMALRKQMDELQAKKNMISRVKNGSATL